MTAYYSSTSKIVGICTVSREQHTIAQTRELECTKIVIPEVISPGIILNEMHGCIYIHPCAGLNVVEIARDIQLPVSKFITDSLALINSFDTWHGELMVPLFYYSLMY